MALIECYECGKQISDKAITCPHCGAPAEATKQTIDIIKYPVHYDGEVMDATNVLICIHDNPSEAKHAIWDMCDEAGVPEDDETVSCFIDQIYALYEQKYGETAPKIELIIPYSQAQINQIEYEQRASEAKIVHQQQNVPKCPTCGSTNVERINLSTRAAATVLFGVVSNTARKQMVCKNCGYKF